ncbi:MAG: peptidoglycan DD-metalloendopeptidase family protein [Bacteroidales bacterium]|nr:peptidoglycan DD-metalloendopeptidase family protein [Bacteroidales bacterium]
MNKYKFKILLTLFFAILFALNSYEQTRNELEKQKKTFEKKIKYTNQLLKQTKKSTKYSSHKVLILQNKISNRNQLINNIEQEVNLLDTIIHKDQKKIILLRSNLKQLKQEYAKMIYYAYKNRSYYDKLVFIFASEDFNQAYKRLKYFQQYSQYRKRQADLIVNTRLRLVQKLDSLEIIKAEKLELVYEKKNENSSLLTEKQQQAKILDNLKTKKSKLINRLRKQQIAANNLQRRIETIIAEEARKATEMARKKGKGTGKIFMLTPEDRFVSKEFYKNKQHLPWPTQRGIVTSYFGEHPHPFLKGIVIRNNGIDITTTSGSVIRSIFEGEVSRVFSIKGANITVIVRHGNYLTVYSNLRDVIVKAGDKLKAKQAIGVAFTDADNDNKTVVKFQIWKENKKLNPILWLAHK